MANVLLEVQRYIAEITSDLEMAEYIDYLRELSNWAENQADMMEFRSEVEAEDYDN